MQKVVAYLIAEPFKGYTQTIIYEDAQGVERVAYSGRTRVTQYLGNGREEVIQESTPDLTPEQYEAERGKFKRVTEAELDALMQAHLDGLKTKPEPMTEARYFELLECLPPCRWQNIGGAEVFHISERLTANLVQWCIKMPSGKCYGFTDDAALSVEKLREILDALSVSKFERPQWYKDYAGLEVCAGDQVRVKRETNCNAIANVRAFHADKNGVRVELDYTEGATQPLARFIPIFLVELVGLDKVCAEQAAHYGQSREQRAKQSSAMAELCEAVTEQGEQR